MLSRELYAKSGQFFEQVINTILPPRCLACGCIIERQGSLCAGCWTDLRFITGTICKYCGVPLPFSNIADPVCRICSDEPPVYDSARAPLRYETTARRLVISFKHYERTEGAQTYAEWMIATAKDLLTEDALLIPVPAHRWRLLARGFNQAALLAKKISNQTGIPVLIDALERVRDTRSQQGLNANQRRRNMSSSAFWIQPDALPLLDNRPVILVDDVLTTGATVQACSAILRRAGAKRVDILTLARVVRGNNDHI